MILINMHFKITVILLVLVILLGCSKQEMPYKSLADTRPTTPSGAAVVKTLAEKIPIETIKQTAPAEIITTENPSGVHCKDSDYGKFANAVGIAKGIDADGSEYEIHDTCLGNILYEYFCVNDKVEFEQIKCSRGCKNGFCV